MNEVVIEKNKLQAILDLVKDNPGIDTSKLIQLVQISDEEDSHHKAPITEPTGYTISKTQPTTYKQDVWSEGEKKRLSEMYHGGVSNAEISRILNRSECAVKTRISLLGLKRKNIVENSWIDGRTWSEDEKDSLMTLTKLGFTNEEISERLDRTVAAVANQRCRILKSR